MKKLILFFIVLIHFTSVRAESGKVPAASISYEGNIQVSVVERKCNYLFPENPNGLYRKITSPQTPVGIRKNSSLLLTLPAHQEISMAHYTILRIDEDATSETSSEQGNLSWEIKYGGNIYMMDVSEKNRITVKYHPGLYLMVVRAWWEKYGENCYGFLLEVSP